MPPETKKKVDQGIDTIFEKVELTTAKAKDLEQPQGEPTTEGQPPVLAQQPGYIGQTRAKMPSPTPKSKGGGKTTTKPTPAPPPDAESDTNIRRRRHNAGETARRETESAGQRAVLSLHEGD